MPRLKGKRPAAAGVKDAELSWLAGLIEQVSDDREAAGLSCASVLPDWFTMSDAAPIIRAVAEVCQLESPKLADVTARIRANDHDGADSAVALVVDLAARASTTPQAYRLGMVRHAVEIEAAYRQRELMAVSADAAAKAASGSLDVNDVDLMEQAACRLRDVLERKQTSTRRLVLRRVCDIECSPVNWLWPQRVVGDGLTIVTGPVGNTKSLFTIDLAAAVSRGSRWPDGTGHAPQGSAILFGAEDDAGKIIRPRLAASGADLERVHVCEGATVGAGVSDPIAVVIEHHIRELRAAVGQMPDCRLIVFDPLPDFISADENNSAEVRAALMPLTKLAQDMNVAVVAVLHQNKKTDLAAVQRIAGSVAFAQIARCVLAIGDHPEDTGGGLEKRRVMLVAKNNYGARGVGQAYRLVNRNSDQVSLEWIDGQLTMDADELVRRPNGGRQHDDKRSAAVDVLRQRLEFGQAAAAAVTEELQDAGFGRRQIEHACETLNVIKSKTRDGWQWRLPAKADAGPAPDPAFAAYSLDALDEVAAFNRT
jgi:putative DNA primase/helicase